MDATIIINAAGCGSRLGQGLPKSLVRVGTRLMLDWQLCDMCLPTDRVRIVVGYRGDEVAALARRLFPSIEVVFNSTWSTTKTAASLSLGAAGLDGRCLSLDGDLLVHPDDFRKLVQHTEDLIGITPASSSQPVFAELDKDERCCGFSFHNDTGLEWTGLVNFNPKVVPPAHGNVFEMISCILPTPTLSVRTVEIDTPEDLRVAPLLWSYMLRDRVSRGIVNGFGKNSDLLAS